MARIQVSRRNTTRESMIQSSSRALITNITTPSDEVEDDLTDLFSDSGPTDFRLSSRGSSGSASSAISDSVRGTEGRVGSIVVDRAAEDAASDRLSLKLSLQLQQTGEGQSTES